MTGAQASYLKTLCEEAGEEFDPDLSKAEASKRIDALRAKTPRPLIRAVPQPGARGRAAIRSTRPARSRCTADGHCDEEDTGG
jgi:hypothetical protein